MGLCSSKVRVFFMFFLALFGDGGLKRRGSRVRVGDILAFV